MVISNGTKRLYEWDTVGVHYKLFKYVHSNPNNPGIESEPILDEVNNRYIGYQTFKEKQKYTPDDVEMIITAGQAIAAEKDSDKDLREKVY